MPSLSAPFNHPARVVLGPLGKKITPVKANVFHLPLAPELLMAHQGLAVLLFELWQLDMSIIIDNDYILHL